jgi:hypothetical protein
MVLYIWQNKLYVRIAVVQILKVFCGKIVEIILLIITVLSYGV